MDWWVPIPKVELHAHLNGNIRNCTLLELARDLGEKGIIAFSDVQHVILKTLRSSYDATSTALHLSVQATIEGLRTKEVAVLVQNEGENTLKVNLTIPTSMDNSLQAFDSLNHQTKKLYEHLEDTDVAPAINHACLLCRLAKSSVGSIISFDVAST
ncbi:hypothetical protein LguiA_014340 [Lonicera macranthoides]